MAEFLVWLGPGLSSIAASAKLLILASELSNVEAEITIYQKQLEHNGRTIASVVAQFKEKDQLIDDDFRQYIQHALIDSKDGLAQIESLIDKLLERMRKKKKVSLRQRITWAFGDTDLAKALDKYIAGCHATMVGIDTRLGCIKIPRPKKESKRSAKESAVPKEDLEEFWKRKNGKRKPRRSSAPELHMSRQVQALPQPPTGLRLIDRLGEAIAPEAVYGRSVRRSSRKEDVPEFRAVVSEAALVLKPRRSTKAKNSVVDEEIAWFVKKNAKYG